MNDGHDTPVRHGMPIALALALTTMMPLQPPSRAALFAAPEAAPTPEPVSSATSTPSPRVTPRPVPIKPQYTLTRGTGFMAAAGATGAAAWIAAGVRMGLVGRCTAVLQSKADAEGALALDRSDRFDCLVRAGAPNAALAVSQVTLDGASMFMALASGFVRGRHDATEDHWSGRDSRRPGAYLGAGIGLLALSAAGVVAAAAFDERRFTKLEEGDVRGFETALRLRYVAMQAAATAATAGHGLSAYGWTYIRARFAAPGGFYLTRVAPTMQLERGGGRYVGVALAGRF